MVNILKIMGGIGTFITGFLMIIMLEAFMPILIQVGDEIYPAGDIGGLVWFIAIFGYILIGLIIPIALTVSGLREGETEFNPIIGYTIAATIFIISLLLTAKGWFWITIFSNLTSTTFVLAIFWVGLLANWILITLITPAYIILQSSKK